jgi:hypothetical protein
MAYGDQVSRPQQDPSSGSLLPPAKNPPPAQDPNEEWLDKYFREKSGISPGTTTGPNPPQPASPEDLIRQNQNLPRMPLPPPSILMDEEGRRFPEFDMPTQEDMNAGYMQDMASRMAPEDWPPSEYGEVTSPFPGNQNLPGNWWSNPPTPESLPQMPLPPPNPLERNLYRGLMPPETRIWQDKPWT